MLFGALSVLPGLASAATIKDGTPVSGIISSTTWTAGNYFVDGEITVPAGETLTIEPGVWVLFDADVQFIVQGSVVAQGTHEQNIRFTRGDASAWRGIRVLNGGSVHFGYTNISDGNARFVNANDDLGGAIYVEFGAQATLEYCVLNGNSADIGGAICNSGTLLLTNCTIADNSASSYGSGLYNFWEGSFEAKNCIFWGDETGLIDGAGSVAYSNIQGGIPVDVTDGGGNIDADPLFVDPANGDYNLLAGSPCIDTGDPNSPLDPDGTRADMGARYFDQSPPEISGEITTQTWAAGEYHVVGDIIIPAGNTLTIEPGVDVLFFADASVMVEGSIDAQGAEAQKIRFIRPEEDADAAWDTFLQYLASGEGGDIQMPPPPTPSWKGIHLVDGGSGIFTHVQISHAKNGDFGGPGNGIITPAKISRETPSAAKPAATMEYYPESGGIAVLGTNSQLTMNHSVITRNAGFIGGGVRVVDGAQATLSDCDISMNYAGNTGGGLDVRFGSTATLANCTVSGNSAIEGGGLYVKDTDITVSDTRFEQNHAYEGGGAYLSGQLIANFTGCAFVGNTADYWSGGLNLEGWYSGEQMLVNKPTRDAGWVREKQRPSNQALAKPANGEEMPPLPPMTVNLTSTLFSGNTAGGAGGAVLASYVHLNATDCIVQNNHAGYWGGGFEIVNNTAAVFEGCVFDGNSAVEVGGGFQIYEGATAVITDCVVKNNTAEYVGGAWIAWDATVEMSRTVFSGNQTVINSQEEYTSAAALYIDDAVVTMTNCTVADNHDMFGELGAIYLKSVVGTTYLTLNSSIVWGNTPTGIYLDGGTVDAQYSIVQNGGDVGFLDWWYYGNLDEDPLFGDDYTLQAGSPAIDAGDPGLERDPDGTRADMGAYSFNHQFEGTVVYGTVTTPTWTLANSPYIVTGEIIIPTDHTLTIEAGVDVLFHAAVPVVVEGAIDAQGAEAANIRFMRIEEGADDAWAAYMAAKLAEMGGEPAEMPPFWGGINIVNGGTGDFSYTRISHVMGDYEDGYYETTKPSQGSGPVPRRAGPDGLAKVTKQADNGYYHMDGRGVSVTGAGSHLDMTNSVIRYNAGSSGGGLHIASEASAHVISSTIELNYASYGGGVFAENHATLSMNGSIIVGNLSNEGSGLVNASGSTTTLTDCDITSNVSSNWAGAIGSYSGPDGLLSLTNCRLLGNTARYGGAIENYFGNFTMTECVISGNQAEEGLAILHAGTGSATLTRCLVSGNTMLEGGQPGTIMNQESGGNGYTLTLMNCTVADNDGGLYHMSGTSNVTNSIFWSNGNEIIHEYDDVTIRYSNIEGGVPASVTDGGGNIDADPLFVDPANGDYTLQAGSPAIDAGDPALPRDPDGSITDMGAFYFHQETTLSLPAVSAQSGGTVDIVISADAPGAYAAQLEINIGSDVIEQIIGVYAPPWDEASIDFNLVDGTLFVIAIADDSPVAIKNDVLCVISVQLKGQLAAQTVALTWDTDATEINGMAPANVFNGELQIGNDPPVWAQYDVQTVTERDPVELSIEATDPEGEPIVYNLVEIPSWSLYDPETGLLTGNPMPEDLGDAVAVFTVSDGVNDPVVLSIQFTILPIYGDASGDGWISAWDASLVLQHAVRRPIEETFRPVAANVSDRDKISAWDAALILYKVVHPSYVFPVEGGDPPYKPAAVQRPMLAWGSVSDGWTLNVSGSARPVGVDIVLRLPDGAEITSGEAFDFSRDGDLVTIAVAAVEATELFRVTGTSRAPEVVSAFLNAQETRVILPVVFNLAQNAPNPFNPLTTLRFGIEVDGPASLAIYDVNGRLVRTLVDGTLPVGHHEAVWDARDNSGRAVASGVYVYRLTSGENVAMRRMVLVR